MLMDKGQAELPLLPWEAGHGKRRHLARRAIGIEVLIMVDHREILVCHSELASLQRRLGRQSPKATRRGERRR